jgi:hypothetical protein
VSNPVGPVNGVLGDQVTAIIGVAFVEHQHDINIDAYGLEVDVYAVSVSQ